MWSAEFSEAFRSFISALVWDSDGTREIVTRKTAIFACNRGRSASKVAEHAVGHVQPDSVPRAFRGAVPDASPADEGRMSLHGDQRAGGDSLVRFYQHSEPADVDGARLKNSGSLTILPGKMNLALDGKARVETLAGFTISAWIFWLRNRWR